MLHSLYIKTIYVTYCFVACIYKFLLIDVIMCLLNYIKMVAKKLLANISNYSSHHNIHMAETQAVMYA